VAERAGVSVEYYMRLEQGRDQRPSEEVLRAIGRALELDRYGLHHLFRLAYDVDLFRNADPPRPSATLLRLLAQWTSTAAFITDRNCDIVAANELAHRVGRGYVAVGHNAVASIFAEPAGEQAPGWEDTAAELVAALRYRSDPSSPRLQRLVSDLTALSPVFARLWSRHDAWPLADGKAAHSFPGFGLVELQYQHLEVPGLPGYTLITISADPGTPGAAVLAYFAAQTGTVVA
jgi:transcriptional regulator with XRE-family HTH domain